jgi:single-strand DNA-binding protein
VIVHGRLRTESWQSEDGGTNTTLQVEASLIGHDLNRGITHFMRRRTEQQSADDSADAAADASADAVVVEGSAEPVESEVAA